MNNSSVGIWNTISIIALSIGLMVAARSLSNFNERLDKLESEMIQKLNLAGTLGLLEKVEKSKGGKP